MGTVIWSTRRCFFVDVVSICKLEVSLELKVAAKKGGVNFFPIGEQVYHLVSFGSCGLLLYRFFRKKTSSIQYRCTPKTI